MPFTMNVRKKAIALLLAVLLFIPLTGIQVKTGRITEESICYAPSDSLLNGGWLEERDGIKILHISL